MYKCHTMSCINMSCIYAMLCINIFAQCHVSDKTFYEEKILRLVSDVNKFRKLNEDPTLTREGQLQRF